MRKKRKNVTSTFKQKKIISTRLIQISMRLDDYVYKNKPITATDAAAYVEEITTYKSLCADVRALQVIEKLTRCMNSIISEQQDESSIRNANTKHYTDQVFTSTHNTCVSPVYSLPDEDKIFFTQASVADEGNANNVSSKDLEFIDLRDDDTSTSFQINVDVHRAISNLSIKENVDQPISFSQSLIDNYQMNDKSTMEGTVCIPHDQIAEHVNSSVWSINNLQLEHSIGKCNIQDNVSKMKCTKKETNTCGVGKITISGNNTTHTAKDAMLPLSKSSLNVTGQNEKISIPNSINKAEKNKQIKINKCNRKRKPKDKKNNNKTIVKDKLVEEKTINNKNVKKTIKIAKENGDILRTIGTKIISIKSNNIMSGKVTTFVQTSTISNSVSKNYNKYADNDLSWMKNIKYVREIATDEFDPKQDECDENFWHSCSLPKNWDDQDFNE